MSHKTAATVAHTIGIDTGKNTLRAGAWPPRRCSGWPSTIRSRTAS
jgi:hypothetical protein